MTYSLFACDDSSSNTGVSNAADMEIIELEDSMVIDLNDMQAIRDDLDQDLNSDESQNTQVLLEELYRWDRILRVSIVMEPESWNALRQQSRSWVDLFGGEGCLDEPFTSVFTWFKASVTIDGESYPEIDVRKKGFLGSLSESKPSLKLDLGEYNSDQKHLGARRFTLNNSVQDPALIRQCLAYDLSNQAGIPAPRCNFAWVEVNGEALGIYVNIEPYKRNFFEDRFGSYEGNVYEGTVSDFTEGAMGTFEAKNNDEDRSLFEEIVSIHEALAIEDNSFVAVLQEHLNLEQFIRYWALESLLKHSDGYSGNRNNYYLYSDPDDMGRLKFLMWGTDGILNAYDVAEDQPQSVYLKGIIAWRLYQINEWRERYFEVLDDLLEELWDETSLIERVDERIELLGTLLNEEQDREQLFNSVNQLKQVINQRRRAIAEARENDLLIDLDSPEQVACLVPNGYLAATFKTEWGMLGQEFGQWFEQAEQELEVSVGSIDFDIRSVGSAAGTDEEFGPRLNVIGSLGLNNYVLINVSLEEENWISGTQQLWSEIYYSGSESDYEIVYVASSYIDFSLEEGAAEIGAPIIGQLSGDVLSWSQE